MNVVLFVKFINCLLAKVEIPDFNKNKYLLFKYFTQYQNCFTSQMLSCLCTAN